MNTSVETLFTDLEKVLKDLEKVLAASSGDARASAEQATSEWRSTLKDARAHLEQLQDDTRKQIAEAARAASRMLRENPGKSLAIVGAAGFLLGLALRRHERPRG